jgi:TolA-binding protein
MNTKNEDKFGKKSDIPNLSELFGDTAKTDVAARDVFGGDLSSIRQEDRRRSDGETVSCSDSKSSRGKSFNLTQFIMIVNLAALTGILIYLLRRPAGLIPIPAPASAESVMPVQETSADDPTDSAMLLKTFKPGRSLAAALEGAISLQTAETFYAAGDYEKAAYVYERLGANLTKRTIQEEALADWLTLQMALCVQKTQEQDLMTELFTRALNSRSPVVRALATYNLAFIQNHNRSYLEARQRAYQTLALLKTFESYMPPSVEADCYFLAAESLTRYLLRINNMGDELPGIQWSDSQPVYTLPVTDQEQLGFILTDGIPKLSTTVIGPKVAYDALRPIGSQWSAAALDGPLSQLLMQFASEAKINLNMDGLSAASRDYRTTLYMPMVDRHYLAEVTVGSAGLIWRFDGQMGQVQTLSEFSNTDMLRQSLVQDAIATWQRFLLRYRGDERTPNAHYCLGLLYALSGQTPTALGEYKLLAIQHANNPLAPYALLASSKHKINLLDYAGAQNDLNELLIRYPNCKIIDEVMLYLAEATMNNGSYAEAAEMFKRVYYLNINPESHRRSAFGLGRCAFELGQFEESSKWLAETLSLIADKSDNRFGPTCVMLGRSYIQSKQFTEASKVLRYALGGKMADQEYVQIMLELAESEMKQEQYVNALSILESIPEERFSQEDSVAVMLVRARLYRQIDVPATAISLLRRKIQFIAESRLRALLSLELAECYLQNSELTQARNELNEAMPYLPAGFETQRAGFLLARIAYLRKDSDQAKSLCLEVLKLDVQDEPLRRQVYDLLGEIYTAEKAYDRAALAYAGLLEQLDVQ